MERALGDELLRMFDRQEAVVLARLQGTKARKHTRHWEPAGERKIDPAYILDPARWLLDAVNTVAPGLRRLYTDVYARVEQKLTPPPADGVQEPPPPPPPPPAAPTDGGGDGAGTAAAVAAAAAAVALARRAGRAVTEAVGAGPADRARAAREQRDAVLEDRLQRRLDSIATGVRTAAEEVRDLIARLEAEGLPMPEIVDRVREHYRTRRPVWVQRIATVNVTGAINEAGLEAARARGALAKQWLSSRDDRVRDTHDVDTGADGQVRALDEPFLVGAALLQYPGDPTGPLEEIINCRCTLLFSTRAPAVVEEKKLPKTQTCSEKDCDQQATKRVLWAEGMAYQPACDRHVEAVKKRIRDRNGSYGEIDGVQEIKAVVRTAAGAAQYDQPIGSVIHRDTAARMMDKARAAEPKVTAKLRDVVDQLGGKLAGLENRFKDEATLADKIPRAMQTYGSTSEQVEEAMPDTLRYTAVFAEQDYTAGVTRTLAAMKAAGYAVEWQDTSWGSVDAYSGVNTNLRSPDGLLFELQMHTAASLAMKTRNHADFTIMRDFSKPLEKRQQAWDRMTARWATVPVPPGAAQLPGSRAFPRPEGKGFELKDVVRTPAGAQHYQQPIGSVIVGGGRRTPKGRPLPDIAGLKVERAGRDPDVRALVAKHTGGKPPRPEQTRVLAAYDGKDRIAAYIVWQSEAGGEVPKGTVREVWVHPSQRGKRIGNELQAQVAQLDPDVPAQRARAQAPAPAAPPAVPPAPAPARGGGQLPTIRSRAEPGDTPGSSGDFDADAARIDRLQRAYMKDGGATDVLFSRGGRYTRERERQQQEIIEHFLSQPGVKRDRSILVLGGLPGAGKTTTINSAAGQAAAGVTLSEYVTVNADEVKEQMVARGMVPDYPGLSADEAATLIHKESFEVAHSLMRQAAKRGLNFAYDTSLKSTGQMGFATGAGRATAPPGWRSTLLFVDVPVDVAKERAKARYLAGGRYIPLGLIDGMRSRNRGSNSHPADNFKTLRSSADRWVHLDNTTTPTVVGKG